MEPPAAQTLCNHADRGVPWEVWCARPARLNHIRVARHDRTGLNVCLQATRTARRVVVRGPGCNTASRRRRLCHAYDRDGHVCDGGADFSRTSYDARVAWTTNWALYADAHHRLQKKLIAWLSPASGLCSQ